MEEKPADEAKDLELEILTAMARLTHRQKMILGLRSQGLKLTEIAEASGLSVSVVKHLLLNAQKTLRRALSAQQGSSLFVLADLDLVPAHILVELLGALDELHRAHGGGGLRVRSSHAGSDVTTGVAV